MKFDFTPDPKVLLALTHTPMQPMDALCELIDNAIDSFHYAKIQGIVESNPLVIVQLPSRKQAAENGGLLRIQDNGPGMTAQQAEKSIKAGFSGNNPYDTLGLFGMGFNISTGKLGNITTLMTARKDSATYVKTVINLEKINQYKNYELEAVELPKGEDTPFKADGHGTIIEVSDWWPEGNANKGFIQKLVNYGLPRIREELGRRYSTILKEEKIQIFVNDEKCVAFEHCVWSKERFVTRKNGNVPAVMFLDRTLMSTKRCGDCAAVLSDSDTCCPACGSTKIRTIDERVYGWIGIQRFDDEVRFGIDLIRNGRAIRIGEQKAFFEFEDEFKRITKDYPIDSQYGRIVGEIHLDHVPVDFLKQDFQRSSAEWQRAMSYIRGDSSLQPTQPNADKNESPLFKLYQAYRRVRRFGKGDMYMGMWDASAGEAKRISRQIEQEYYEKFKQRLPGYFDDTEWWKLVESADQPPVEELPACPDCGTQNLKEAEICVGCGKILKGKPCISCKQLIPLSASSCPHCGADQTPKVLEPWTCKVCGQKNVATAETCSKCGSPKGANNPLDVNELLKDSIRIDSLSHDDIRIKLADGSMSKPVKVNVYSMQRPLISPISDERFPLVVDKNVGEIAMFVDLAHPYFAKCNLSKEQLIASEIAMHILDINTSCATYPEHNLSNLTWRVLDGNWKDEIELSFGTVYENSSAFLSDLMIRVKDALGTDASIYFDELSPEEKSQLTNNLIQKSVDLSSIGEMKESGEYLLYTPYSFILTLYRQTPDSFFGGGIWSTTLAQGGESLLGSDNVAKARKNTLDQYFNYLQDVIYFHENKYSDVLTLRRVKLSLEFLSSKMA